MTGGRMVACSIVLTLLSVGVRAAADPAETCAAAYNEAQDLRKDDARLVKARDRYRSCASDACPTVLRDECRAAIGDLDRLLPTVVLAAVDHDGKEIVDVTVFVDGAFAAATLDRRAIPLDAGPHRIVFARAGGASVEVQAVVPASVKEFRIVASFAAPGARLVELPTSAPNESVEPVPSGTTSPSPWPVVGVVGIGVGALGVGLGAAFGISAIAKKGDAGCDGNDCTNGDIEALRSAKSAGSAATALLVGGIVLAGAGLSILLLSPKSASSRTALRLRPSAGLASAGWTLEGWNW